MYRSPLPTLACPGTETDKANATGETQCGATRPRSMEPVWLDIAVSTSLSLEGLLKPIIDGLDPILGVDPSATLEFTPNDDRVEWLRIHRQPHLPCAIVLAAGPTSA